VARRQLAGHSTLFYELQAMADLIAAQKADKEAAHKRYGVSRSRLALPSVLAAPTCPVLPVGCCQWSNRVGQFGSILRR
jgi:hypothetical protein